ncbi:MAG TPA: RidA family protein [Candidatus Acidoferrales bacterium]|nr:RidA family protein [Candidatus Acidoferrales bacterium]
MLDPSAASTEIRKFAGRDADELAILCRPTAALGVLQQAEVIYRALAARLGEEKASFRDVASENLFVRDASDLPLILDTRARVLAELGQSNCAAQPSFVQQAPIDESATFELVASVVVPHRREVWSVQDIRASTWCTCEGCKGSAARLVRLGDQTSVHTSNVYGAAGDRFEQALDMFLAAERLLGQCGMRFTDVVRTWIFLRDIDRDYDLLNKARREFFQSHGIEIRPASTGVQGIPCSAKHDFSMSLYALKGAPSLPVSPMSTPTLNEAWIYGSDFSRGLRVVEANKLTLFVSGTASIDDAGQTVHVGNFEAQAERMLGNIESLLAARGARFADVISAVTYLKNRGDAPALRAVCRKHGFDGFPCALVEAPLCRPELLCETEAVAMLPAQPGKASDQQC